MVFRKPLLCDNETGHTEYIDSCKESVKHSDESGDRVAGSVERYTGHHNRNSTNEALLNCKEKSFVDSAGSYVHHQEVARGRLIHDIILVRIIKWWIQGGGVNPPPRPSEVLFLAVRKFLLACLFEDPEPPPSKNSWIRPCYNMVVPI